MICLYYKKIVDNAKDIFLFGRITVGRSSVWMYAAAVEDLQTILHDAMRDHIVDAAL